MRRRSVSSASLHPGIGVYKPRSRLGAPHSGLASIDAWLGHEPMPLHRNDVAGLRAFILLKQASPEGYARIADETWQKWAPVIVGLPRCTVIDKSPEIAQILMDALNHAPAELLAAVRTIIRSNAKEFARPAPRR
jgi:hypothetical protein